MANTGNTQQQINYGAAANDGQGDPLRTAFIKTDNNFDAIWNAGPVGSNITIVNNTLQSNNTNGNIVLRPNGVGVVQANAAIVPNASNLRDLGTADLRFRAAYVGTGGLSVDGNIAADHVTVDTDLTVNGNLIVEGDVIQIGNIVTDSLTIQLANTATTDAQANGSGITVGANDDIATLLYNSSDNEWRTNVGANVTGNVAANYFVGNGSLLTGILSTYSNTNVASYLVSDFGGVNSNTVVTTGNIVAAALDVANIAHASKISIQTNGGGVWEFAGNILRGPQGGSWDSSAGTSYFNSPPNGYINISSLQNDSVVSEIFMEHSFIRFLVDNGGPEKTWQMNLSGEFSVPGDIIPQSNGTASLGNSTNYWSNLWVANNTIYIGGVPLGVTGNVLTVNGEPVLSNDSESNIATTGTITAGNIITNGISSDDSTFVTVQDGLSVAGDIESSGNITVDYFFGNGSLLTGVASTGNITFSDTTVSPPDGVDITISAANSEVVIEAFDIRLDATDDLRLTGNDIVSLRNRSTTDPITIRTDYDNNDYGWEFAADGTLTTPGDIITAGDVTGTAGASTLYFKAQPASNTYIQLNNSVDSVISTVANLEVRTDVSNTAQVWSFDTTGNLTAPGNITATNFIGSIAAANVTGLANVATTGAYADLTGTPTIPSLGDFTITDNTIQTDNGVGGITLSIFGPDAADPPAFISQDWTFANTGAFTSPGPISATGNITGSNIITTGNVSATRLQNDGNLEIRSNVAGTARTWTFDTLGDFNLPVGGNIVGSGGISANNITLTGNISANTAGFAIGYRDIPQVAFTGNATIAAADAGKHFYSTESTDYILTIADNSAVSWPVGTAVTVVNRGTGNITVAQAAGVSLYLAGNSSAGNRTVSTYGMVTLLNVAANVWMINGTGVA